jgi:carboxyl-terminal processing protease
MRRLGTRDSGLGTRVGLVLIAISSCAALGSQAAPPSVLAEIDARVRAEFWDPKRTGADWSAALRRASGDLAKADSPKARDAVYDRLLATLRDSHTFRIPSSRLPPPEFASPGLRIGRDGDGFSVKGILPGSPAEKEGLGLGSRVLAIDGRPLDPSRFNLRDLFLDLQGRPGTSVEVSWRPPGAADTRVSRLSRVAEPPGDALVWGGARVLRDGDRAYGYLRLWGIGTETALTVVDLLFDREEIARRRPELAGWTAIDGVLLDLRGNTGGYDPGILTSFFSGGWTAGEGVEIERGARRTLPSRYTPLPTALLVNAGTASSAEIFAAKFRAAGLGILVGETTAGMGSGGASIATLSDGSQLWITRRAYEDGAGRSYEGRGVAPDVAVADLPSPGTGRQEPVVEAAMRELSRRRSASRPGLR